MLLCTSGADLVEPGRPLTFAINLNLMAFHQEWNLKCRGKRLRRALRNKRRDGSKWPLKRMICSAVAVILVPTFALFFVAWIVLE